MYDDYMANEGFYDSLEEEFSSASSTSVVLVAPNLKSEVSSELNFNTDKKKLLVTIKEPSQTNFEESVSRSSISSIENYQKIKCNVKSGTECRENCDISSIVPLYGGDKYKSEVRSSKKSSSIPVLNRKQFENESKYSKSKFNNRRKQRSKFTKCKQTSGSCSNIENVIQDTPSKSYLGIFHARIGYPRGYKKQELQDTVRSIFGDSERTLISNTSTERDEFRDAKDYDSDTTSFYLNQIEENDKVNDTFDSNKTTPSVISSLPPSNFNSVSQLLTQSNCGKNEEKRKLRSWRTKCNPVPKLGGLGPDTMANQEKLERRKKQLRYGQRASNRNRIKMVEMNALKNLKNEIQKSNLIDKKQDDYKSS